MSQEHTFSLRNQQDIRGIHKTHFLEKSPKAYAVNIKINEWDYISRKLMYSKANEK